jgi:hypothetical protein
MSARLFLAAMAIAAATLGGVASLTTAKAQGGVEAQMLSLHQLCNQGDKGACVRFGVLIGQNKQRQADWRRAHADWFWWEKL